MDEIKKEGQVDTFISQFDGRNGEEKFLCKEENNMLKIEVDDIKLEPSEPIFDLVSDVKYEENDVPDTFPVVKFEVKEESWHVDAVKELPDETKYPEWIDDRSVLQNCDGVIGSNQTNPCEESLDRCDMVMQSETQSKQTFQDSGFEDNPSTSRKLDCEFCNKHFTAPHLLRQHKCNHLLQQTFKCDICAKTFAKMEYLRTHALIHTDTKNFKCDICQKCFRHKHHLLNHISSHTGDKKFKCDFCDRYFRRKEHLQTHSLIHTGNKPFKCDICGKGFARLDYFRKHTPTHTGERNFKCDICGKHFRQKSYLTNHTLTHTPFQCKFCGQSFQYLYRLEEHAATHTDAMHIT